MQSQPANSTYIAHAKKILQQNNQHTDITCSSYKLGGQLTVVHLQFADVSSTMLLSEGWDRDWFEGEDRRVFVFRAKEQTKGRGQKENKWYSPPGNLYMTILIQCSFQTLPHLFMIACVEIAQTIQQLTGAQKVAIKWINDVFIQQFKVSGILINTSIYGSKAYAEIGIGLNVGVAPIQYTTCLLKQTVIQANKSKINPQFISVQLSKRIISRINSWSSVSRIKNHQDYDNLLKFKGQKVKIYDNSLQNVQYTGKFCKINQYGFAIIQLEDGTMTEVSSGRMRI